MKRDIHTYTHYIHFKRALLNRFLVEQHNEDSQNGNPFNVIWVQKEPCRFCSFSFYCLQKEIFDINSFHRFGLGFILANGTNVPEILLYICVYV